AGSNGGAVVRATSPAGLMTAWGRVTQPTAPRRAHSAVAMATRFTAFGYSVPWFMSGPSFLCWRSTPCRVLASPADTPRDRRRMGFEMALRVAGRTGTRSRHPEVGRDQRIPEHARVERSHARLSGVTSRRWGARKRGIRPSGLPAIHLSRLPAAA